MAQQPQPQRKASAPQNANNKNIQNKQSQQQAQARLLSAISGGTQNNKQQQKQINDFLAESTRAVEEAISAGTEEARKVQERVLEFSRESAENLAKSADSAVKGFNEAVELGKENFEAVVESANIASKISKTIAAEVSEFTNDSIAENMKGIEEFLSCKTASDFFNLQSNLVKSNLDSCFNEALKLSELFMQYAKAAEPVSERVTITTEKLAKAVSE